MAKSTKSYEERMLEMEKREQESLEKAKRYAAQKKELLKRNDNKNNYRDNRSFDFSIHNFHSCHFEIVV